MTSSATQHLVARAASLGAKRYGSLTLESVGSVVETTWDAVSALIRVTDPSVRNELMRLYASSASNQAPAAEEDLLLARVLYTVALRELEEEYFETLRSLPRVLTRFWELNREIVGIEPRWAHDVSRALTATLQAPSDERPSDPDSQLG